MTSIRTETETVIKRILPYLRRRGYNIEQDIDFETSTSNPDNYSRGYIDLLINCGRTRPYFLIEAKRNGHNLNSRDSQQARTYARATDINVPFYVLTNGNTVQVFNTATGEPLKWNGRLADKVPTRQQLTHVVSYLRRQKTASDVDLRGDTSLPFRPALPLMQLNDLFKRCHNKIRNIEKNEETAFSDFSLFLFLKLLEEKNDAGNFDLPYTYRFWELAEKPASQADQVKTAIDQMLSAIRRLGYGSVLGQGLHLRNPATYRYLVGELSRVSFSDSNEDVRGTAFEYFVRSTLRGKKLGQYFTPRPVIDIMAELMGRNAILTALSTGTEVKILDPACGTGGFLVFLLKQSLDELNNLYVNRRITNETRENLARTLKQSVFYGCDANEGVAASAKMNMIITGDGHSNIVQEDSLSPDASLWPIDDEPKYDYIMTNPPFGTTEGDSLTTQEMNKYPIPGGKGQHLFLQRMIMATKPGGLIISVIDEGLLNTDTGAELRRWVMKNAELLLVLQLPDTTFKPNKINVKSSIIFLKKREVPDIDLTASYPITFGILSSLGYEGSGEEIRGFDFDGLCRSLGDSLLDHDSGSNRCGNYWHAHDVLSTTVTKDKTVRWDCKYWNYEMHLKTVDMLNSGAKKIKDINTIETHRGRSPKPSLYVDSSDGYAVVIKAGSNITQFGDISIDQADWIEKQTYDDMPGDYKLQEGDVLLSSTGDGTLGKCAVWNQQQEAVADSHITIIRPKVEIVDPYYLADFLRAGFGKDQIQCLYTGGTGLIELTVEQVDRVVVPLLDSLVEQRRLSSELRNAEQQYQSTIQEANEAIAAAKNDFEQGAIDV